MNILITSAGRRVSLLKAFEKEAYRLLGDSKVYCCDASPELSAACQSTPYSFRVPELNDPDYITVLLKLCSRHKVKLVIPTIDTELILLAENRSLFAEKGITILVSDRPFIEIADHKRRTHEFFLERDIPVAKEYNSAPYPFPVFIKPFSGSSTKDAHMIRCMEELRYFTKGRKDMMILEYLDHEQFDEFTCDLYYDRQHNLKCIIPRKRLLVRAGEVNKGITIRNHLFDEIRQKLDTLPGARGCICVQFFVHKEHKNIYGIEINPRFSGGFPLTYAAGGNFPKWVILEYLLHKEIPEQFDNLEENLLMLRYDMEIMVHGGKTE